MISPISANDQMTSSSPSKMNIVEKFCIITEYVKLHFSEQSVYFSEIKKHIIKQLLIEKETKQVVDEMRDIHYPHFQGIALENLNRMFVKSYMKVQEMSHLVQTLEKNKKNQRTALKKNIGSLQSSIQCWAMHYLDTNSVVTILHEHQVTNLPFWVYSLSNAADYYRGDGGSALDLCEKIIKDKYPCLNRCRFGLIPKGQMDQIIHKVCFAHEDDKLNVNYHHKQILSIDGIEKKISKYVQKNSSVNILQDPVNYFLDITNIITDIDDQECQEDIGEIEKIIESFEEKLGEHPRIIIGGCTPIGNQDLFFFFPMKGNKTQFFADRLKDFQGSQGFYPEIIEIKKTLIQFGITLDQLPCPIGIHTNNSRSNNRTTAISLDTIKEKLVSLENKFREIKLSTKLTRYSGSLVLSMLKNFQSITLKSSIPDIPEIFITINNSLEAIETSVDSIVEIEKAEENPGVKFQKILQETNLIVEEMIYLQIFLNTSENVDKNLNKHEIFCTKLNALAPQFNDINKQTFVFTSGIKCFGYITDSLVECKNPEKEAMLQAMFLDTTYYELRDVREASFTEYIRRNYKVTLHSFSDMQNQYTPELDILFVDLYPNYVTYQEKISKTDVPALIRHFLIKRTPTFPFIVVLDTAITLFFDSEIVHLVEQVKEHIEKKELIFIVTSSLSKFFPCGIHKYTGGIVQIYSNYPDNYSFFQKLKERQDKDALSDEALFFLDLLASECIPNIQNYLKTIRENTDYVYKILMGKGLLESTNGIILGKKDKNVPMISLSLKNVINKFQNLVSDEESNELLETLTMLMQYYIYAKATVKSLPLHIRSSFAFLHSSITECSTALRLTIGMEEETILDEYIGIIIDVNNQLLELLEQDQWDLHNSLLLDILCNNKDLSKPVRIKVAMGTFIEFLKNLKTLFEIEDQ